MSGNLAVVARPEGVVEASMDKVLVCRTSRKNGEIAFTDPPVLANPPTRLSSGDRVYFLAGAGLIKIGYSAKPQARICAIRGASPVPLELIGMHKAGRLFEGLMHGRFAGLRRHGEWFEDTAELRAFIDDVLSGRPFDLRPGAAE